ncbi:MAG: dockerin type I repeat-containing protein, partial [Clostridia bacterium]|nr:dockerin type I repeat-containing protein [Clostridia bacterium]
YYMDFNVKYPSKIYHQYATALYDQCEKAVSLRKACTTSANATLTFKIPVYTSLPLFVSEKPTEADYYVHTCTGEIINAKSATCTEDGYTGDTVCKECGEFMSAGSVIPKTGHTESDWLVVPESNVLRKVCTECGAVIKEQPITVVTEKTPGDINGDGDVDNKDLTRLFQFLSEWDVSVNAPALDVNGDSYINNKDLTRLFQYLSEWEVEIF